MARVMLNNVEQTAYWWIKVIRIKLNEISRNPENFSKEEHEFFRLFSDLREENWREIYLKLKDYIAPYSGKKIFSQNTSKKGHQQISDALSKILGRDVPDINLSPKNGKQYILDMHPRNIYVSCKVKERIPFEYQTSYSSDYNYVITGNENDLKLYNLVLSVFVSIRKKNANFKSLGFLRKSFCEKIISDNNLSCSMDEAIKNFDAIIKVLREHSIIECETLNGKERITKWPIIANGLDSFSEIASEYSEYILDEYNKYLLSRVVTPIAPKLNIQNAKKSEKMILAEIEMAESNTSGFKEVHREQGNSSTSLVYFDDCKNEIIFNYDGLIEVFKYTITESGEVVEKGNKCKASYHLGSSKFDISGNNYSLSLEDNNVIAMNYDNGNISVYIERKLNTERKHIVIEYRCADNITAKFTIEMDSEEKLVYKPVLIEINDQYDTCPCYFNLNDAIETFSYPWSSRAAAEIRSIIEEVQGNPKTHIDLIEDTLESVVEEAREFANGLPIEGLSSRLEECLGSSNQDCNRMRKVVNE